MSETRPMCVGDRFQPHHGLLIYPFRPPVDLAAARLAVQKQPTDWMAWLLLADALQNHSVVEGLQTAIDNALAFAAEDASVVLSISSHSQLAPTAAPTDPSHH